MFTVDRAHVRTYAHPPRNEGNEGTQPGGALVEKEQKGTA
jgi:hypothetical protein